MRLKLINPRVHGYERAFLSKAVSSLVERRIFDTLGNSLDLAARSCLDESERFRVFFFFSVLDTRT